MPASHWAGFVEALDAEIAAEKAAAQAYRGGKTWDGQYWPTWWGSSDQFAKEIRDHHPRLHVDESSIVPLDGAIGWSPSHEAAPPPSAPCPTCRDAIGRGSSLYCPRCQLSGHEHALAAQRGMAGPIPPPDVREPDPHAPEADARPADPTPATPARRPTRRERRAALYGRPERNPAETCP